MARLHRIIQFRQKKPFPHLLIDLMQNARYEDLVLQAHTVIILRKDEDGLWRGYGPHIDRLPEPIFRTALRAYSSAREQAKIVLRHQFAKQIANIDDRD